MVPTNADLTDQLERELERKKAYDQQMEQRMINAAQGMMNSNVVLGMGSSAQNAAQQNALWNGANTQKISSGNSIVGMVNKAPKRARVRMDVAIEQAKNGYVLTFGGVYNESTESHIATTFEDINTIINSELASRMLEQAE